jgi:hypothetical protein
MQTHAKVLGILNIISGGLGLMGAMALLVIFGVAGLGASTDSDAAIALPIIGLTGAALVLFTVAMSLPAVIVGYGLYNLRPWARIFGIVLSVLSLMVFPFGTALGIYGLWVLLSKDGARLFEPAGVGA